MNVLYLLTTVIKTQTVPTLTDLFCVRVAVHTLEMEQFAEVDKNNIIFTYSGSYGRHISFKSNHRAQYQYNLSSHQIIGLDSSLLLNISQIFPA